MTRSLFSALLALGFLSFTHGIRAQTIEDYTVVMEVDDTTDKTRNQAFTDALKTVIERVTQDTRGAVSRAKSLTSRAPTLVRQYRFDPAGKDEHQLIVTFDQAALDNELRNLGLPVWGVASAPLSTLTVRVGKVSSAAAYARVLSAARSVPGVKQVTVLEVGDGAVTLGLQTQSDPDHLAASVQNSGAFRRSADRDGDVLNVDLR